MGIYEWKKIYLDTFIPQLPKLLNDNFEATKRYINIFYDPSRGVIIAPVNTPGQVRAGKVESATGVFDTLVVRQQFTNLYNNSTTIDADFYNSYSGPSVSPRLADASIWENTDFGYVDVMKPYYKITNDASIAFKVNQLGQEFQLIFDPCTNGSTPYTIMLDPSTNSGMVEILTVDIADAPETWIKLIAVEYDASWGTTWTLKQFSGTFTRTII